MTTMLAHPSADDTSEPSASRSDAHTARCEMRGGRLVVSGEIDQWTRPDVRTAFVEAMHARDLTAIDLTGVTFFGATGVGILAEFGFHERLSVLGSAAIRRVLDIVGSRHLLTEVPPTP
ncbi:MAG: STAS domain-containing protein [Ilumatobacter sp.]|uniref:STAS domain-containing protein n=1 Tax=Ilumatobacter sp. TaxID=1967498 RepID=UPI003297AFBA